jgi:hypothetical protein
MCLWWNTKRRTFAAWDDFKRQSEMARSMIENQSASAPLATALRSNTAQAAGYHPMENVMVLL